MEINKKEASIATFFAGLGRNIKVVGPITFYSLFCVSAQLQAGEKSHFSPISLAPISLVCNSLKPNRL
jgi:hypothetical protein